MPIASRAAPVDLGALVAVRKLQEYRFVFTGGLARFFQSPRAESWHDSDSGQKRSHAQRCVEMASG